MIYPWITGSEVGNRVVTAEVAAEWMLACRLSVILVLLRALVQISWNLQDLLSITHSIERLSLTTN